MWLGFITKHSMDETHLSEEIYCDFGVKDYILFMFILFNYKISGARSVFVLHRVEHNAGQQGAVFYLLWAGEAELIGEWRQ